MARYHDLTGTLAAEMWSYRPIVPDVPIFEQRRFAMVEERGWEADAFAMATLTGTYLETAKHLFPERPAIDEVPPERFFVEAVVVRIPKGPRGHITVADLEAVGADPQPGEALLVATGWDRYWWDTSGETFVGQSPHFDRAAMEWIVAQKVSILGGDMSCFDDPQADQGQDVNRPLFDSGAMILAPLVGLDQIVSHRVRLNVFPMKLRGACGAPCRAIAIEE